MIRIGIICLLLIAAAFEYLAPGRERAFIASQWDAQLLPDSRPDDRRRDELLQQIKANSTVSAGPVWTVNSSTASAWPVVSCVSGTTYPVVTASP